MEGKNSYYPSTCVFYNKFKDNTINLINMYFKKL